MKCTCVIEEGRIADLCDIHRKAVTETYNRAIDSAARTVMNATNQAWLVERVRGMRVSEPHKRGEGCED